MPQKHAIEAVLARARLARAGDDAAGARLLYAQAVSLARDLGDGPLIAHGLRHLSDLDREAGDLDLALAEAREAAALYRAEAQTPRIDLANALRLTGLALDAAGRRDEGARAWAQALEGYRTAGVEAGIAECRARLEG